MSQPEAGGEHILIADPSATSRSHLLSILEQEGYQVDEAENGPEAYIMALQSHYDLVITDATLPGMDGFELIRKLRTMRDYHSLPILTLSTEHSSPMKLKGQQAGATGWVVRPFVPKKLLDVVQLLSGRHPSPTSSLAAA